MVDTNIIISAGLFPNSIVGNIFMHIMKNHELILSHYTLNELKIVFKKKFSNRIEYINKFLNGLKYELIDIKIINYEEYPEVRDIDDIPVLAYAIESKVEILITGDKDFDGINLEKLQILKPKVYFEKYMK
jgi:putative PIN family toxin of toxin-antitoxin system